MGSYYKKIRAFRISARATNETMQQLDKLVNVRNKGSKGKSQISRADLLEEMIQEKYNNMITHGKGDIING